MMVCRVIDAPRVDCIFASLVAFSFACSVCAVLPQAVSVKMMAVAAKKESFFIFASSNFVDSINQHDLFILLFYDFKQLF